jgi:hypothetical protein
MVIAPALARRFIGSYKDFLLSLLTPAEREQQHDVVPLLVKGRERWVAERSLLDRYRAQTPQPGTAARDDEMLDAIAAARIGRWVYLKDTRTYSVLLDEQAEMALAVLDLTQPLRALSDGSSGLVFEAAVLPLAGHWVCDGLISGPLMLGGNLRRSCTERYTALRAQGRFSAAPVQAG